MLCLDSTSLPTLSLHNDFFFWVGSVYLGLNDCRFEGPLPSEMGRLWNMTRLQMQKNDFTGTIPGTYGRLDQMEQFTIEGNRLTGTIPNSLCENTKNSLRQFVVDCYDPRRKFGFNCEPECCTLCRDVV